MNRAKTFTVSELAVKCKSKTELYNLLAREGKMYLPPKTRRHSVIFTRHNAGRKVLFDLKPDSYH